MIISSIGSATSSCRHSSRNAEQRWPAERKAEVITSSVTCSGSAVASTIIGVDAAGFGDQRHDRPVLAPPARD